MTIVPVDSLLGALDRTRRGTVREAEPDEEADFVKDGRDKLATAVVLLREGGGYSVEFTEPVYLVSGRRYVFVFEAEAPPAVSAVSSADAR